MPPSRVYLGLGSNLGDRAANLAAAVRLLSQIPETVVLAVAGEYETRPVGGPDGQGDYLNSACMLETDLTPFAFLDELHRIERSLGRRREAESVRWGPRPIDLDILLWNDMLVNTPDLTIPHPRLAEREFVLRPLADIAPDMVHPVLGRTVKELLQGIATTT